MMRLFALSLLSLLALPLTARATPFIDDLVIVGDGHTISFSLASVVPPGNFVGAAEYETYPTVSTATIDGIGGYNLTVFFYAILNGARRPTSGGIDINLPGAFDYNLAGAPSVIDGYGPTFSGAYLVPGNYTLYKLPPYNNTDPFSVSITPEDASSAVPEPGTFGLILLGILALPYLVAAAKLQFLGVA